MIVKNISKNRVISGDCKIVTSPKDQIFGLLDQSNSRTLLFKTRFGIHTFFMNKPIDVVVLNAEFRVVKFKASLQPNGIFFWDPKYFYILEMENGVIKKSKIGIGDQLEFLLKD